MLAASATHLCYRHVGQLTLHLPHCNLGKGIYMWRKCGSMFECRGSYVTFLCKAEMAAPLRMRASTQPYWQQKRRLTPVRSTSRQQSATCSLEHPRVSSYPRILIHICLLSFNSPGRDDSPLRCSVV